MIKKKTTHRKKATHKRAKMSGVKRKTRRRSRMGNAGSLDMTSLLLVIGGAVGAKLIDKVIPDTLDKKIVAGGKIAVGFLLPMLAKDAKTKAMLTNAGYGFLAVGTIDILTELNVLSGTEDGNDLFIAMSGTQDVLAGNDLNVINGDDTQTVLAGEDFRSDLSVVNGMDDDDDMR